MKQDQLVGADDRSTETLADLFFPNRGRSVLWPRPSQINSWVDAVAIRAKKLRPITGLTTHRQEQEGCQQTVLHTINEAKKTGTHLRAEARSTTKPNECPSAQGFCCQI